MTDTQLVQTRDSDHFNNPDSVLHCGPEAIFKVTFGSASTKSIVATLCDDDEQRKELLSGTGRYSAMRQHPGIRNDDLYKYLRLGVSSHCALAFQAIGYPTPESLENSPEIGHLFPDALARKDREYPLEFIARCEREGIAALECQAALRRGITTVHLGGILTTEQLITLFNRYVRREGIGISTNHNQKSIIDYFIEGTLPFELHQDQWTNSETLLNIARTLSKTDPSLLEELRNDLPLFRKFAKAARTGIKEGVEELRGLMLMYGQGVLDLSNPYICSAKFTGGNGTKRSVSFDLAQYIESVVTETNGALWNVRVSSENVHFSGKSFHLVDMEMMHTNGVVPSEFREFVFEGGLTPRAVVVSKTDHVERPLMGGVL